MKVVMNLRVPYNAVNFLSSSGRVSFSGRTLLHGATSQVYSESDSLIPVF